MVQEQCSSIKQGSKIIATMEYLTTDVNIFSRSFFIDIVFFFFWALTILLKILIPFLHKERLFLCITLLSLLFTDLILFAIL